MKGYLLVSEETLDQAAEITELPRSFWEREMNRINLYGGNLILFPSEGGISQLSISFKYNVAFVMKEKFGLEKE